MTDPILSGREFKKQVFVWLAVIANTVGNFLLSVGMHAIQLKPSASRPEYLRIFTNPWIDGAPTPVANGGLLCKPLDMPDFRTLGIEVKKPGTTQVGNAGFLGVLMREIMRLNKNNFRLFGPDESQSNRLDAVYEVTEKAWLAESFPEDADGGHLAPDGRVMEMLSEHTLEGWLEGYILSGRHGLINSYESFVHLLDSMVNQHAKWLEKCSEVPWRMKVSSLNILVSGLVWRQDHNGFTHQDPGFLDVVANKSPSVVRIYLPPDAN
jgi:xylulose-5-phosphate/fructose-6-phosphate phosphoketolase